MISFCLLPLYSLASHTREGSCIQRRTLFFSRFSQNFRGRFTWIIFLPADIKKSLCSRFTSFLLRWEFSFLSDHVRRPRPSAQGRA